MGIEISKEDLNKFRNVVWTTTASSTDPLNYVGSTGTTSSHTSTGWDVEEFYKTNDTQLIHELQVINGTLNRVAAAIEERGFKRGEFDLLLSLFSGISSKAVAMTNLLLLSMEENAEDCYTDTLKGLFYSLQYLYVLHNYMEISALNGDLVSDLFDDPDSFRPIRRVLEDGGTPVPRECNTVRDLNATALSSLSKLMTAAFMEKPDEQE